MKTNKLFKEILCLFLISAALLSSCNDDDEHNASGIFYGDETEIGSGTAQAFIKTDNHGNPVSVGVKLTEKALENLPDGGNHANHHVESPSYQLNLPLQKIKTPFDHVTLDWNPAGHPPETIYDKPHFDVHFYMMSEQERLSIGPEDPKTEDLPESKFIPEGYVPTLGGVPQMGKHWIDPTSPEYLPGGAFTQTFMYGTYDKRVTFYEPMVTLNYLKSKPNTVTPIAQPKAFQKTGIFFPSKYRIEYDEKEKVYLITLEEFSVK